MKSIAYNHLGNRADAEDAVQEAFLKVHRSIDAFRGDSEVSTWMYRILINTCRDHLRRRKVRPEETTFDDIVGSSLRSDGADDVLRMTLRNIVGRLGEQRRTVFLLCEVEGFSHREVAEILQITVAYSKWLLFVARKDIREMWKREH